MERITEPERVFIFRVSWEDDEGNARLNRGYRVQFNNALGPYKGGLRFHPSVNLSILKFLAFEQTFKNALTTLPLGRRRAGPILTRVARATVRFCVSASRLCSRFLSISAPISMCRPETLAWVSAKLAFCSGSYKRITGEFVPGVLTGKSLSSGGSLIRREATGYGAAYFAREMLEEQGVDIRGKRCLISGSGNVAQYCAKKLIDLGATVHTLSDSDGFIYDKDGIDAEKLAYAMDLKNNRRMRISEYEKKYRSATFHAGKRPWGVVCDLAFPCATQNELDHEDAGRLIKNGCIGVVEGSNMPSTERAMNLLRRSLLFAARPRRRMPAGWPFPVWR